MFGILKNKSTKTIIILLFSILLLFVFSAVAYSAISSTVRISGIAYTRAEANVRITDFSIHEVNNATSSYEEFSKDSVSSHISFDNSNSSYIIYKISITNYGSTDVGINKITGLSENLKYELIDYNLKDKICDQNGKCNNFAVKTFYIKISGESGNNNINMFFDFKEFYNITYENMSSENYPSDIFYNETLNIDISSQNIPGILVFSEGININNYSYDGNFIKIPSIKEDITIKAFSYIQPYNYTGDSQEFVVPYSGIYKIELWGASGGNGITNNVASENTTGLGAYTSGEIMLEKDNSLFFYVGGVGANAKKSVDSLGGFNGGGNGSHDHTDDESGGAGGGASDVRLVNGVWNNFDSLKSRIMVAAGGGGEGQGNNHLSGGFGGGLNAEFIYKHSPETIYKSPVVATQTGGYKFGIGATAVYKIENFSLAGAGGGYYGGDYSTYLSLGWNSSEGSGGSSFISGHDGCDAISETSLENNLVHTAQSIHYSGYNFSNTKMIDGSGYGWTTQKNDYIGMPTHDGVSTMTGNKGNGYAKVSLVKMQKTPDEDVEIINFSVDNLQNATSSNEKFTSSSIKSRINLREQDSTITYKIEVKNYGIRTMGILEIIGIPDGLAYELIDYNLKEKLCDNTGKCNKGAKKVIYLRIKYENNLLEKTTYNIELDFNFKPFFNIQYENVVDNNYPKEIMYGNTLNLNIFNSNAPALIVKLGQEKTNNYSYKSGILNIENVMDDIIIEAYSYNVSYDYTGSMQEINIPYDGIYKIELWGASGGGGMTDGQSTENVRGLGGYVSGNINLTAGDKLFVNVGGKGADAKAGVNSLGGYNGGGNGRHDYSDNESGGAGGGATDIRLVGGSWDNFDSLKSRIMVAAGGGGESQISTYSIGGYGGGLIGGITHKYTPETIYKTVVLASQTSGYKFGIGANGLFNLDNFGFAGGGGGYYGGDFSVYLAVSYNMSEGGGGSSFISGHDGCNAIDSSSTENSILHTGQCVHYSNYKFTDTIMIDGEGYSWTKERGITAVGMPNYDNTSKITGNKGNGYAKIRLIEMIKE